LVEKPALGEIQSVLNKEVMEIEEVDEVKELLVTREQGGTAYVGGS